MIYDMMPKVLSIDNMRLFLNTLLHVQASISHVPCYEVSSVSLINLVVGFDTIKKFVGLTHLIKPVLQEKDGCPFFINMPRFYS
jgi:hypothetical protein